MRVFAPHAVDSDTSAGRHQMARGPLPVPVSPVLAFNGDGALQRQPNCACGGDCPGCQSTLPVQMKLAVSQPRDAHEQEADQVADQIMRMAEPTSEHTSAGDRSPLSSEEDDSIQRTARPLSRPNGAAVPDTFMSDLGPGEPLDSTTREFMEPRFGHDFSGVRLHKDSKASESARAVNARAYTVGQDVVFAEGELSLDTTAGRRLLAHELTHVLQQRRGGAKADSSALRTGGLEGTASGFASDRGSVAVHGTSAAIARTPRSLGQSLNAQALRDDELATEIQEIRLWLFQNPLNHPDRIAMLLALTDLETAAAGRATTATRGTVEHTGTVGTGASQGTVEARRDEALQVGTTRVPNFLAISYAGANAANARWLQFVWFEMQVVSPAGITIIGATVPTSSGTKPTTTNLSAPNWSLDFAAGSPYYIESGGAGIRDASTQAMFDRPGGASWAGLFRAALSAIPGATSAIFTAHFSTYLVINDVVQYLVPWSAATTATVSGSSATIAANVVYTVGTAGAASALPANLRTILLSNFPTYTNVR